MTQVIQGTFIDTPSKDTFRVREDHYLVHEDGIIQGVFADLPPEYADAPLTVHTHALIIPGLIDLHLHAPQLALCGTNMDLELLPWLESYVFVEEAKFAQMNYAEKCYVRFVQCLLESPTTRACIFGTIHKDATLKLMELLEQSGMRTYVGKVSMDQNAPAKLTEESAFAIQTERAFVEEAKQRFLHTHPIITPRFVPSCTAQLLEGLGEIAANYNLPVQSHLSENTHEIAWVHELFPEAMCYADVYARFGLLGGDRRTIMAHAVHSSAVERELLHDRGVYIAHCAQSNTNLSSGIAPIKEYLKQDIVVGLGTDIAGGAHLSLMRAVCDSIQVSKLLSEREEDAALTLTFPEAFHAATAVAGSFFGNVGQFAKGYAFDALALKDDSLVVRDGDTPAQRLERIFYLGNNANIAAKYVEGTRLI